MEKCLTCNFFVKGKFFNNVLQKFSVSPAFIIKQFQIIYWKNAKECQFCFEGIRNCRKGNRSPEITDKNDYWTTALLATVFLAPTTKTIMLLFVKHFLLNG